MSCKMIGSPLRSLQAESHKFSNHVRYALLACRLLSKETLSHDYDKLKHIGHT
jgi:hypothetical protein